MFRVLVFLFCFSTPCVAAAQVRDSFSVDEVRRIISILSSDSMKGRGNYSPSLRKAGQFIINEFAKHPVSYIHALDTNLSPFPFQLRPSYIMTNVWPDSAIVSIVRTLKGRSRPDEIVIISAHYDHLGVGTEKKDSIYNGANDNASGITALLTLAHYFALRNDNERTLVFCAFAGEELGLLGSTALANQLVPLNVIAVINIEMIGLASRKNSFFITGAHYSDVQKIIRKNLSDQKTRILNEPGYDSYLFERSDNYPFARRGIPAHTIMTMGDDDPCYHEPCDEWERLDLQNMTVIIKAIAIGIQSMVDGRDTPKRINTNRLRRYPGF